MSVILVVETLTTHLLLTLLLWPAGSRHGTAASAPFQLDQVTRLF